MPLIGNNFSAFSSLLRYLHISTSAVLTYLGLSPNPLTECLLCFDACSVAEQILLIIKKRWDGPGLGCAHFRELATTAVWRLEAPGGRGVSPWGLPGAGTGSQGCPTAPGRLKASGEYGQPQFWEPCTFKGMGTDWSQAGTWACRWGIRPMAEQSNGSDMAGVGIQVDTAHRSFSLKGSLTVGEGASLRLPSRDIWES